MELRFKDRVKMAFQILGSKSLQGSFSNTSYKAVQTGNGLVFLSDSNETYVNKGYGYNADVFSVISMINEKIASCPILLYEVKDEKALNRYKSLMKDANSESFLEAQKIRIKAFQQVEGGHELLDLIEQPNPLQDRFSFIEQLSGFYNITGNSYIRGFGPEGGSNAGKYQELYLLPSSFVEPLVTDNFYNPLKGYRITLYGKVEDIQPEEMIAHIRTFNPDFGRPGCHLKGMSPLKAYLRNLTRSNEAKNAAVASFQNGGARGILYDNAGENEESRWMSKEQGEALQDNWNAKWTGTAKQNAIKVTSYKLGWQQIGLSPVDLAILESEKVDMQALCNVYKVPYVLFNSDKSSYNNITEAEKAFVRRGCMPLMYRITSALNRGLLKPYNKDKHKYFLDFDYSALPEMQADMEKVAAWVEKSWELTPNEKREAKSYGRLESPGMDEIWMPTGLIKMTESGISPDEEAEFNKMYKGRN